MVDREGLDMNHSMLYAPPRLDQTQNLLPCMEFGHVGDHLSILVSCQPMLKFINMRNRIENFLLEMTLIHHILVTMLRQVLPNVSYSKLKTLNPTTNNF